MLECFNVYGSLYLSIWNSVVVNHVYVFIWIFIRYIVHDLDMCKQSSFCEGNFYYTSVALLYGAVFHTCLCQFPMSTPLCIWTHVSTLRHISAWACQLQLFPLFFSVICLCRYFFFSYSHLCSCHVPVPVHQWASALSTRSPWPQMSDQAAARQVHCAPGLCFTSSHPSTSCSVMLTVIESK